MKLKFVLKRKDVTFSERQILDIKHHIDKVTNWTGLKQDFISIKFISISSNSFTVEVEDTGKEWRKHLVRKLIRLAKLDNVCVPPTNQTGRVFFEIN